MPRTLQKRVRLSRCWVERDVASLPYVAARKVDQLRRCAAFAIGREDRLTGSDVAPHVVELMGVEPRVSLARDRTQPIVPCPREIRIDECGRAKQRHDVARFAQWSEIGRDKLAKTHHGA